MYYRIKLASRLGDWWGIDGNHYVKHRWIEAIFYDMKMVKERKPYFCTNHSGGCSQQDAINSVNTYLAKGEKPVTEKELVDAIEKACSEIEKNPELYRGEEYPEY